MKGTGIVPQEAQVQNLIYTLFIGLIGYYTLCCLFIIIVLDSECAFTKIKILGLLSVSADA